LIYLDTSVALAHLLSEDRRPPDEIWNESLVSSRLLQYELWVRLNARDIARTHGDAARQLLARLGFVEMVPAVLARALDPFPETVRTLDALHLASAGYLREQGFEVTWATYDGRQRRAAEALGFEMWPAFS
jgi:predicted nucleic acid-binding protein